MKTTNLIAALLFAAGSAFAQVPSYVPTNGLVGWWPFNGNANDESGNGNNGVAQNGISLTSNRYGYPNTSFDFDGNDDQIYVNNSSSVSPVQNVTVSAWIYPRSYEDGKFVLVKGSHVNLSTRSYGLLGAESNQKAQFRISNSSTETGVYSASSIPLNSWTMVTGVYDGSYIKIFINGVFDGQILLSGLINQTNEPLTFGSHKYYNFSDYWFDGKIDDICIWNRALTQQEISSIYQSGQPTILSNTTFNQLPYSPAICMEKLNNGNLIVGSGDGKVLQFDSSGIFQNIFYSYNQNSNHFVNAIHKGFNDELTLTYNGSGYTSRAIRLTQSGQQIQNIDVTQGQTGVHDIRQSSDGTIILAGHRNCGGLGGGWDMRVTKYDTSMASIWNSTQCLICGCPGSFCSFGDEISYQVVENNGDYYLAGYRRIGGTGCYSPSDAWIIKVNSNGQQVWNRIFGGSGEDIFYNIKTMPNGNTISCGVLETNGNKDIYLVCLDPQGNTTWTSTFGTHLNEKGHDVIVTNDGNLLVAGIKIDANNQPVLVALKIDFNGNLIWQNDILTSSTQVPILDDWFSAGQCLLETSPGKYALAYSTGQWYSSTMGCGIIRFAEPNLPCNITNNFFSTDTLSGCGNLITLDAGNNGSTYNWNTGASTQSISANSSGWYTCTVSQGTCTATDSVFVNLLSAGIVQNDTTICAGESVALQAVGNGFSINQPTLVDQFTMTFGGPFSRTVNTEIGAVYSMTISGVFAYACDFNGQCDAAYAFNQPNLINHQFTKWNGQTIRPNPDVYNPNHIYDYSNLLSTQSTQQFIFTDNPYGDNCGSLNLSIYKLTNPVSYLWSTGATTASINVTPTQTTTYYVTVSNGITSCTDSVTVTVANLNSQLFSQDTLPVCGTSATLDAGSGYSSYSWNTGATTQSISVSSTGWYTCTVNQVACTATDSVFVSLVNADIVQNDTTVCLGSTISIAATGSNSGSSSNFSLDFPNTGQYSGNAEAVCSTNLSGFDLIGDFTIEFWIKAEGSFYWHLMGKNTFGNNSQGWLLKKPGNDLLIGWTYVPNEFSFHPFNFNQWEHVAICFNDATNTFRYFKNGQLISTQNRDININPSPYNFIIGHELGTGNWFDGKLDNLRISNVVRYIGNYNPTNTFTSDVNTVAMYGFNEGSGSVANDLSGNNRNLALFNTNFSADAPSASALSGLTYLWSTGATTASINVTPTQTTTYYVTVSNGITSCTDSVTVTVVPGSTAYYADNDNDNYGDSLLGFFCSPPAGGITQGGDCDGNNPAINPGVNESCNSVDDDCDGLTDEGLSPVVGAINGIAAQCIPLGQGGTSYTVAPVAGALQYQWSVPAGMQVLTGQGTDSITVFWNLPAAHVGITGAVSVTVTGSCGTTTQSTDIHYQISVPVQPSSISGPVKVCPGDVATYSVYPVARARTYNWNLPAGMSIISGAGSHIIQVQVDGQYTGGMMSVSATNSCGTGNTRTKSLLLNTPVTPKNITGQSSGLCGAVGVQYSIPSQPGANSYNWSVPSGALLTGGQGSTSVTVDYSSSFGGGSISVSAVNNCGSSTARSLTIGGAPSQPGPVTGPTQLCPGAINQVYSINTVSGATTYNWGVFNGVSIVAGQGTKNLTVNYPFATASGKSITVSAGNNCGTSVLRYRSGISIDPAYCVRAGEAVTNGISIYPNPAKDALNFGYEGTGPERIEIFNILGEKIIDSPWRQSLDISSFSAGVYVVRVSGEEITSIHRVEVVK